MSSSASMGPALVSTMVHMASEDSRTAKLHPFFTQNPTAVTSKPVVGGPDAAHDLPPPALNDDDGRKTKRPADDSPQQQDASAPKKPRKKRASGPARLGGSITSLLVKPDQPSSGSTNANADESSATRSIPPLVDVDIKPPLLPQPETGEGDMAIRGAMKITPPSTQAKRVLKFNPKTGTLGSPPKPKQKKGHVSMVVTVNYGADVASKIRIGEKITQILAGELQLPETPTKSRRQRKWRKSDDAPNFEDNNQNSAAKPTHPFFGGTTSANNKPAVRIEEAKKSPSRKHSVFMSTPVSPRKPRSLFPPKPATNFGSKPVGMKIPGAMHPAWPSLGMAHVRGENDLDGPKAPPCDHLLRKFKGQVVSVNDDESVLHGFSKRIDMDSVRETLPQDDNHFPPAPKELRLPTRHFESGRKLRKRVHRQLQTCKTDLGPTRDDSDIDELAATSTRVHSAVSRLYNALATQLSAYDKSTCESMAWTQKYAPTRADEVLQAGKEAILLKQWLEALQVQSVETGTGGIKSEKPKKKRGRPKLDDFIVDSDDEGNELDEISDNEGGWTPAGNQRHQKTVVRPIGVKHQGRVPNAAIISGPHGSGKSAAVYAVARELGFEIFEINSSSRRSGKDLLERVGDMTRNHLVQQHQAASVEDVKDGEDQVDVDIKSGKQGTMTAFFKPKPAGLKKEDKVKEDSKPAKNQKQSLILLEEVDVLYEEDKQFWATLMSMIAQSKRPFIMTCNEEHLLPIQALNLHGIFRFSPPPMGLAMDVCLLIAANEGHALRRSAIECLYRSRGHDLRATITELNYWCQIGVGDRRGGFDWFYLRWPKGTDLDEDGDVVRVISEDTYLDGMGWVGRDPIATAGDTLEAEQEAMEQCWDSWQIPVGDWHRSVDMETCVGKLTTGLQDLDAYALFSEAMSASDLMSCSTFGDRLQEQIDPCLPELTSKVKEDFLLGRQILDASVVSPATSYSSRMSMTMSSLARQRLLNHTSSSNLTSASQILTPIGEDGAVAVLDAAFAYEPVQLRRHDLSIAFDPVAVSDDGASPTHLEPSVFDGTLKTIVADIAPWVRSIVAYDDHLMEERKKLSSLLSEGGSGPRKRMRTTRSAYSALEGGERKSTRRDRYFRGNVHSAAVLDTGMKEWRDAANEEVSQAIETAANGTAGSVASEEDSRAGIDLPSSSPQPL